MKISKVVEFLESVKEDHGDIDVRLGVDVAMSQSVTGFWLRTVPSTGECYIAIAPETPRNGW